MEEIKYCAFIDVLGYGNLVMDDQTNTPQKVQMLHSIYSNLATQFWMTINQVNKNYDEHIYIRSFSDCFYLDCSVIEPLLVAIEDIFSNAFGFYSSFSTEEERTPLLRCGIVKDWVIKFRDISAITNNREELNPVGKGVARAYYASEKSRLSGMRIILSPEVVTDLQVFHLTIPDFRCFIKDIRTYQVMWRYYFKHIQENEAGQTCDWYEMLWPFSKVNDHAYECVDILQKLKTTFTDDTARHFLQTARLFHDSYLLSEWKVKDISIFQRDLSALRNLSGLKNKF